MNNSLGRKILGVDVDPQSRCAHWHSAVDVVAMRFKCCRKFLGCRTCHDTVDGHSAELWDPMADPDEVVALCGVCHSEFTLTDYLPTRDVCPKCRAAWNPGCVGHRHLYFKDTV